MHRQAWGSLLGPEGPMGQSDREAGEKHSPLTRILEGCTATAQGATADNSHVTVLGGRSPERPLQGPAKRGDGWQTPCSSRPSSSRGGFTPMSLAGSAPPALQAT